MGSRSARSVASSQPRILTSTFLSCQRAVLYTADCVLIRQRIHHWQTKQPYNRDRPPKMSDFEDEMDVDTAPAQNDAMTFSADASKGKRSTANLPVEAEDTLPW